MAKWRPPVQRVRMTFGNVNHNKTVFLDKWPNGRPYKHGAMEIFFQFPPGSRQSAEEEVEEYLRTHSLLRSEHYHIPAWNWTNSYWHDKHLPDDGYHQSVIVTFADDETFVMAKLGWGDGDEV